MEIQNQIYSSKDKIVKNYSLSSDKSKKYNITFIERENNLYIKAEEDNNMIIKKNYEGLFSMEKLKENKFLYMYNSLNEILDELFPLIDEGKTELKEENDLLNFIIKLPIKKVKEISFELKTIEKNDKSKIDELYQINQNLLKRIEILEKRFDELEKKKIENEKLEKIDSVIIKTKENYDFLLKIIKENIINKNPIFKLLYRATRDGDDCSIFHQRCDNNRQILVLYKTTKGIILGGYTEVGYQGNDRNNVIDNKAFFFSCDRKKVYKVKQNKTAIYDNNSYGPTFGACTTIICVEN